MPERKIPKARAKEILQGLIDRVEGLRVLHDSHEQFERWKHDTEIAIEHIFSDESRHMKKFKAITYWPPPTMFAVAKRDGTVWSNKKPAKPYTKNRRHYGSKSIVPVTFLSNKLIEGGGRNRTDE